MTQLLHQPLLRATAAVHRSPTVTRLASVAVALIGMTVLVSWHAHWTALLQIFPNSAAIKYNTGVCFILYSIGLLLLTTRFDRFALLPAGLTVSVALLTLLEYLRSLDVSIDELVVRDYILSTTDFPGRMSQLTAGCFILLGLALVLATAGASRWRLVLVASLACIVAVVATVALLGCIFAIEEAYGWGAYTRMAVHTAAALLILSLALFAWVRQVAQRQHVDLLGRLPIIGSVTLMTMIAFVSSVSLTHLKSSYDWSRHSYDVLFGAQALLGDITDMQRGARGYVLSGEPAALEPYWTGAKGAPLQLAALRVRTRDNAAQRPRLDQLATDIDVSGAYAKRLMEARDSAGIEAAARLEASGEGQRVAGQMRADMQALTDAERRLLVRRNALTDRNLVNTSRLLVVASVLAAALLMWAHFRGNSELRRRRRAEAALHQISTLQRTILNAANYAIIATSTDRVVTTFNSTAERWLGYAAAEVIGKPAPAAWYDVGEVLARAQTLSEELGYPVSGSFETLVARARLGQSEEREWTMIRKDGSRFPVWRSVTAQVDDAGNIAGFVSVITDITERKQHEIELRLSQERFRGAFDDAPIGMALISATGRWLKVNRVLCEMLDYSDAALLKMDVQSVTHRDDLEPSLALIRRALAGDAPPYHIEKRYLRKDGSVVCARLSVSLVRDSNDVPLYFVTQIEDISRRRAVARMKNEFISTVSHELRTPLTSIRGALGLLAAGVLGPLSEKAAPMVRIAHQNSERLVCIINDILDVEKISAGKVELRIESVPVAAFLEEALEASLPYGVKYKIGFILEPTASAVSVLADRDRLMQVMVNLLSNAAKFSPPGAVVRVRASEQGTRTRIEVEDRGTGIPAAFRARVFEQFAQADASAARHFEGTGLGLSITRELIMAMGGTIGFTANTGQGTTFHFELPQPGQTLQLAPAFAAADTAPPRSHLAR